MVSSFLASKKSLHLPYGLHSLMDLMRWLFRRTFIWTQKEILQVLMTAEERKEELRLHPLISHHTVPKRRWTQSNWARKTGGSLTTHLPVDLLRVSVSYENAAAANSHCCSSQNWSLWPKESCLSREQDLVWNQTSTNPETERHHRNTRPQILVASITIISSLEESLEFKVSQPSPNTLH